MAASYAHPAEVFILALAAFAGPLFCRPHLVSFFAWLLFRQMDAVKTHSGWVWPGVDNVLHQVPYYEGAVFHDYHHRSFIFNYASRFTFIDLIFGTYKVPYDPLVALAARRAESGPAEAVAKAASVEVPDTKVDEEPFVFKVKTAPPPKGQQKRSESPRRRSPRRK